MNILLVNVDSAWNMAIRKYYTYFTQRGDNVEMRNLELKAYPHKKRVEIGALFYDEVYVSNIFERNAYAVDILGTAKIFYGGIGSRNPEAKLPPEVEACMPYIAESETEMWTFVTRGCVNSCWFCKVPKFEGKLRYCNDISFILENVPKQIKTIQFLDNNVLGLGDAAVEVFQKICEWQKTHKVHVCFNQGLDWRLVTDENLEWLAKMKYDGDYTFAFDSASYENALNEKIKLIKKYIPADYRLRFYLYHNDEQYSIKELIHRVEWCRRHKCTCYVMRDQNCYNSPYVNFYTDYAAYCNLPGCFKKMNFKEFLFARHTNTKNGVVDKGRIDFSCEVFKKFCPEEDWIKSDNWNGRKISMCS